MLKAVLSAVILIIAVILYTVYLFLKKNFNGLSWEEIVFHLKVPMKGTSNEMILDYFRTYGIRMGLGVCLSVLISVVCYIKDFTVSRYSASCGGSGSSAGGDRKHFTVV